MIKTQADTLKEIMNAKGLNKGKTKFIVITSGKGGVGKSTISANFANLLAKKGLKVGLFDADLGLANLDIILNVRTPKNILHVLKGECSLQEIIVNISPNLFLIPGESGAEILTFSSTQYFARLLEDASYLDHLDYLIIDTGAGIGASNQVILNAADVIIVVTVPDPAAITDAYATIKVASAKKKNFALLINMIGNEKEALSIHSKMQKVVQSNLEGVNLDFLGFLPNSQDISSSIKQRLLFSDTNSSAKDMLSRIVTNTLGFLEHKVLLDPHEERRGLSGFFKKLINKI